MNTIETISWNKEKVKSKTFDWFQQVVKGYVESGVIAKPTDTTVRKQWEKLTDQKLSKTE